MTPAQKWSEENRPPTPIVDALQKEYHSKMTTRLRIWALARKLELALQQRDALLLEALEAIRKWNDPARGIVNQRDLQQRISAELGDSHE